MVPVQKIFRVRRNYNQWVNNQTLEDYALRFTAHQSRRWSLLRVANTALGAISFLALEAIGAAITLSYGTQNALAAIVTVSLIIFLIGIPICYYAARFGVDIDLLTRGAGFGYIGSTATSLIYASFTFIFFALEAAIMAKALELTLGLPLELGYVVSTVVVIPLVFHGITFISRFQAWTQPLWVILQFTPLIIIFSYESERIQHWGDFGGVHQDGSSDLNIYYFGAAASVMFALVAQIGEQVDFLRFLPEKSKQNSFKWWAALISAGPGWILIGMLKLIVGSFLAYLALSSGVLSADASDPTVMYLIAFEYVIDSPNLALIVAGVFVIISQLKINVTNAYAGSIAWSNFFSRLTHSHPGRVVWLVFNVSIALLLMELGVYHAFESTLSVYAIVAVAWVGALVSDLTINKPLGLSPKHIEFKRAHLYDVNPVGVGSMLAASIVGILAYLNVFGDLCQSLAHFIALGVAFILAPLIAYMTHGKYYLARNQDFIFSELTTRCAICENVYENLDMAYCPVYDGAICSLCCSLDSRCHDACKKEEHVGFKVMQWIQAKLPVGLQVYINSKLLNFTALLIMVACITGVLLSLIYTNSIQENLQHNQFLSEALWKVFFILMIVAGVICWLFVLAHDSRIVAEQESQRQNSLLLEEIEAHKKTDMELQKAKDHAESANNAKSRYITGISHELRTPLNSVMGYAQLLEQDEALNMIHRHPIQVIRRSAEHLNDLIEGLLDISKIEAGRLEIGKDSIHFNALIKQVVDMFKLQAETKGLKFVYTCKSNLPMLVEGDEKRLRQILINILSNAVKFTESGEVELSVRYRNQVAEFAVRDTGVGIPQEELERIFKPFERIRHPGIPSVNGTGLGLTITRLLVDIMGGDLKVQNNQDGGVTFTVWLMLGYIYPKSQEEIQVKRVCGYGGKKKTILVVDDDAAHRGLINDILAPLGFSVIEAYDAYECLKLIQDYSPDAFIIDRLMPGMEGTTLADTLRERGYSQPILIVSANAKEDVIHAEQGSTYNDYIIKPIRIENLLEKLSKHLKLSWVYNSSNEDGLVAKQLKSISGFTLPSQQVCEEIYGWAEVGALSKIKAIISSSAVQQQCSKTTMQIIEKKLQNIDLDGLMDFIRLGMNEDEPKR